MKMQFDENGVRIQTYSDADTSREARIARRQEYVGLQMLPFYSAEQIERMHALCSVCRADNRVAFEEGLRTLL